MNLRRVFHRIFVAIAILWFMTVAAFTIALIPTKQEAPVIHKWELAPIAEEELIRQPHKDLLALYSNEELLQTLKNGISALPSPNLVGMRAAIRNLQRCGKLPPDPNFIYKLPSFWQSEEGTKFIEQVNVELLRKWKEENRDQKVKFVFEGFLFWAIPLVLVYIIVVLIWWVVAGFLSSKM
jgi:hypothetical protein